MAKKVVHPNQMIGRPRELNREQIAIDLVEWSTKEENYNLCKFCFEKRIPPSKISQWAKDDENFRQAYELAKASIGYRREQMLSDETLHVKAYDLNAKTYDYFLKEEHRAEAEFQASLKKEEDKQIGTIEFKVNYAPGSGDTIQISPQAISTKNPPSPR